MYNMNTIKHNELIYYKTPYDKFYITKCGKVIKILKKYIKDVEPGLGKAGYYYFSAGSSKIGKKAVHRVMGQTFLENPKNLRNVDHIDRNKTNNNLSNLRWFSQRDNMLNQECKGVSFNKEKNAFVVKDAKKVLAFFETEREGHIFKRGYLLGLGIYVE